MNETCINRGETEERAYLVRVRTAIRAGLDQVGGAVSSQSDDVIEMKKYLQDSRSEMDHVEKAAARQDIAQMAMIGEHSVARGWRLTKLHETPYFGRIDFKVSNTRGIYPVYIGIHSFVDPEDEQHLVHDWRAPIASMFYDFELGEAFYDAPAGRREGELVLKRQYRISKGELVFMLDTSLNIHDEVLLQELSRTTDDRMKNIVATIQRDQNAIIRNDRTHALIIQGAAGSGKTSIALHRIAFLLYKFKDSIRSEEILIISPNQVFAHYISQVLPELGEEMIKETTMEALAAHLLDHKVTFQSFYAQVSSLLEGGDPGYAERIRFKATPDFLDRLNAYARHVRNTNVQAEDIAIGGQVLPAAWVGDRFSRCGAMPYAQQINEVTQSAVDRMKLEHGVEIAGRERTRLRSLLRRMITNPDLVSLYKAFYAWLGEPEMFRMGQASLYEYADIFPLILLKIHLEGGTPHDRIKHLVIDEMQDYTPVQYHVVARLFPCRKTILGDHNQAVNPLGASSAETIRDILPQAECMFMNKSYRSTLQITRLAQRIHRNEHLIPIERHGEEPEIIACADADEEMALIRQQVQSFMASGRQSMGIICKLQRQANAVHARIRSLGGNIHLLHAGSTEYSNGVVVATAHLAKGLEFDQVVVPFCSATNYHTRVDRHMLYVACTRAMHQLTLTHTASLTPFLGEPAQVKENGCRRLS